MFAAFILQLLEQLESSSSMTIQVFHVGYTHSHVECAWCPIAQPGNKFPSLILRTSLKDTEMDPNRTSNHCHGFWVNVPILLVQITDVLAMVSQEPRTLTNRFLYVICFIAKARAVVTVMSPTANSPCNFSVLKYYTILSSQRSISRSKVALVYWTW